ncbi:MAG: alpha/beta hydrolase [Caulobacterales bacterium]
MIAVRRFFLRALLVLVAGYLLVVAAAFTFQRSLLYFPTPTVAAPEPAGPPMQVVQLTTQDRQRLVAWYLPPQAGRPVILFFSGNGDTLIGQTDRWREIAGAGVGVLAVAYRGYSGSSGHPTEAGLYQDAEAAYAWLAARHPAEDIVIHGHSLGSGVAVRLAAGHPARALILEAPFTSAVDVAAERYPWLPTRLLMWDRYDSMVWIRRVRMPILVVHGDADAVIPFAQGQAVFARANAPKSFVRIAGGGHDDLPALGLYGHIWRFLDTPALNSSAPHLSPAPARP